MHPLLALGRVLAGCGAKPRGSEDFHARDLRYVKDPKVEAGLRELIAEAEKRLEQLEAQQRVKARS